MATYQKKFIPLKDAAIISGYTISELKNFTKIGLVPFRKSGNRLFIRFDAFEKINEHRMQEAKAAQSAPQKSEQHLAQPQPVNLVPFTKPHPVLVKVLEPVAFTAAAVMALHIAMMPTVAEQIVWGLEVSARTVAFMGDTTQKGLSATLAMPYTLSESLAAAAVPDTTLVAPGPLVAGVSVSSDGRVERFSVAPIPEGSVYSGFVETALIGIADASDGFQRILDELSRSTQHALVGSLTFEQMDPFITSTFRW